MSYSVVWTTKAEQQLAAVWLAAPDRDAVTLAISFIEAELRINPIAVGESRGVGVERVVFARPIGVGFYVIVDDEKVYVTAVWAIRPRAAPSE